MAHNSGNDESVGVAKTKRARSDGHNAEPRDLAAQQIRDYVKDCWVNDVLSNIMVRSNTTDIPSHTMALGCQSELFAREIQKLQIEAYQSRDFRFPYVVDLSNYSRNIIEAIVRFAYTSHFIVNDKNVDATLGCATEIGFRRIIDMCRDHLKKYTNTNALLYFNIAARHDMSELAISIYNFILENFIKISNGAPFLEMPYTHLKSLLADDGLHVPREMDVSQAIYRWINNDRSSRDEFAVDLLKCTRMQLVPLEDIAKDLDAVIHSDCQEGYKDILLVMSRYLEQNHNMSEVQYNSEVDKPRVNMYGTARPPLSWQNTALQRQKLKVSQYHTLKVRSPSPPQNKKDSLKNFPSESKGTNHGTVSTFRQKEYPDAQPRKLIDGKTADIPKQRSGSSSDQSQRSTEQVVPIIAPSTRTSHDNKPHRRIGLPLFCNDCALAIPHTNCVNNLPREDESGQEIDPSETHKQIIAVSVKVIGANGNPGNCVHRYNPITNNWTEISNIPIYSPHHGTVSLKGFLYVIGGIVYPGSNSSLTGRSSSNVQVVDPLSGMWYSASPMTVARAFIDATTDGRYIYVAGGEDDNGGNLDSVERYDPEADKWEVIEHLKGPRIGVSLSVYRDKLYVIGGIRKDKDTDLLLDDVDCLDLQNMSWIKKTRLSIPICHARLVIFNDNLYIIGGKTTLVGKGDSAVGLDSIKRYDDERDTWHHVTELATAAFASGCALIGNKLFIIGGMRKAQSVDILECFDLTLGQWIPEMAMLSYQTENIACCTISA